MENENQLFYILDNIYTNEKYDWILHVDIEQESFFVIYLWLGMSTNERILSALRQVDTFIFFLEPFQQLLLLHAVVPKAKYKQKNKWVKKLKEEEENLFFLYEKVRSVLSYSEREFDYARKYLHPLLLNNLQKWFRKFGIEKDKYKQFGLSFNDTIETPKVEQVSNALEKFSW